MQSEARLSSATLFKKNLLDPVIYISTSATYILCHLFARHASPATFLVIFGCLYWLLNRHIEAYRSFAVTRRWVRILETRGQAMDSFLGTFYACEPDISRDSLTRRQDISHHQPSRDSFDWINKIISIFWPYLSHVVHHELNEFLRTSSALVRNQVGLKRLLYAFVQQIDANILAIEHCELGARAPFIKSLMVYDPIEQAKASLVYDLDLAYEGNMSIVFICRYFCCCSSRMGLRDVFVHLKSRLALGPIDSAKPALEGISFSLLELPEFGYKGIALVELTQLKLAKRSINRLIREHVLYPKCVSIKMSEMEAKMKENAKAKAQQAKKKSTPDDQRAPNESSAINEQTGMTARLPWGTRLLARMMYFTCMCSNCCLRCFESDDHHRGDQAHKGLERLRKFD